MIPLTHEQKIAVESTENVALHACPGSGKTRVILAKLLKLAESVEDTPRSIACITYTNAAVDEIESRLRQLGSEHLTERIEVSTIHSFCLNFILRPYQWLVPEVPKSFKILSPQSGEFSSIVETVEDEFNRPMENRTLEDYSSIRRNVNGEPDGPGISGGVVTRESAMRYWELLRSHGYLDFSLILYYSYRILNDYEFVARGISSRFKWLLVDEYQDTTDVQIEILKNLAKIEESQFFLVGDPNQSIQGFAGARTDLGNEFANQIGARKDLNLTGNFRSSTNIVVVAERIITRRPKMIAVGTNKDHASVPQYNHCNSATEAILNHFLPLLDENQIPLGKTAILAPWWQHLIPIARTLRSRGVPVFGPGARPYKKSRLYAVLAEQLGACAETDLLLGLPGVEKGIFRLISDITGSSRFDIFTYKGRLTSLSLVYAAREIARTANSGTEWLRVSAFEVSRILINHGWLPESAEAELTGSVEEMLDDMERNNVDINNLQISDLGLFASPENAIKLITLHNSKGREFDAVAMVHLNEGQIPHFTSRTQEEFEESRRLFYVGATRAKSVLLLSSDTSNRRNQPTRYLNDSGF